MEKNCSVWYTVGIEVDGAVFLTFLQNTGSPLSLYRWG